MHGSSLRVVMHYFYIKQNYIQMISDFEIVF